MNKQQELVLKFFRDPIKLLECLSLFLQEETFAAPILQFNIFLGVQHKMIRIYKVTICGPTWAVDSLMECSKIVNYIYSQVIYNLIAGIPGMKMFA